MDFDAISNDQSAQLQKPQAEDLQNGHREPHGAEDLDNIEFVASYTPIKANGIQGNNRPELEDSAVAIAIKNKTPSPQKESAKKGEMSDLEIEDEPVAESIAQKDDVEMSEDFQLDDRIDAATSSLPSLPTRGKFVKKIVTLKTIQRVTTKLEYYVDGVLAFDTSKTSDDKETESTEPAEFQSVTDEVFEAERARLRKDADCLVVTKNLKNEPSEADSDVGLRIGGKKSTRRTIASDDDDDSVNGTPLGQISKPSRGRPRGSSRRSDSKDILNKPCIVLAKYHLDNNYYPAWWYPGKKSLKGPTFCVVKFLDANEEQDVQRSSIYEIREWMTEGRQILVKIDDSDYEDNATILKVLHEEGQPPSYVVKMESGVERTVKLDKVALGADEHLRAINDDKQPVGIVGRDQDDFDKVAKLNGNDQIATDSPTGSSTKRAANQRSSERTSTRLRTESPLKSVTFPSEKKAANFPSEKKSTAPKASAKKTKPKEPTPEPEEETVARGGSILTEDPSVLYRIGNNQFHKGEKVFAMWEEDKRWYSARIGGVRQSKFRIDWCENDQVNYVSPEDIIREKDILKKGLRVNVIAEGKAYYDEMNFTEYMEDGEHLMQTKKGVITPKSFNVMMIQADEVKRWKKSQASAGGAAVKSGRASHGVASTSKKRPRSPTPERVSAGEEKSSKRSSKAKPEEVKESSPVADNALPFANSAFIITSGADKDPTFERDYIVKKVEELGGAVLNTFEDLASSAGKRYLVAPTACRTAKYLQCLAANIPCVSHKWILEIAEKNGRKSINFEAFRLPAGKSSQSNKMINWTPRKTLLDNLLVGLYGGPGFRATWVPALKAGKAEPTVLEEKDVTEANIGKLDVVIVEDIASPKLVQACNVKNIGLVTVEWIIQTLIHGTKQNYDFWPYQNQEGGN